MLFLCQLIPRMSTFDGKSIHLYDMTKNYGNVNNFIGERFFNTVFFWSTTNIMINFKDTH